MKRGLKKSIDVEKLQRGVKRAEQETVRKSFGIGRLSRSAAWSERFGV
jgi:hypothetical protein